jgi:hypothetical protein
MRIRFRAQNLDGINVYFINKQALNLNDLVVVVVASANLIFEIDSCRDVGR